MGKSIVIGVGKIGIASHVAAIHAQTLPALIALGDVNGLGKKSDAKILFAPPDAEFGVIDFSVLDGPTPEIMKKIFGKAPDPYKIGVNVNDMVFESTEPPTVQYKKFKKVKGKQFARPFIYFDWVELPEASTFDELLSPSDERRINIKLK